MLEVVGQVRSCQADGAWMEEEVLGNGGCGGVEDEPTPRGGCRRPQFGVGIDEDGCGGREGVNLLGAADGLALCRVGREGC